MNTLILFYRYLEEPEALGTAGGLDHFRSVILEDSPSAIFVLNADVCGDLPVSEMVTELSRKPEAHCLLLTTEATRDQSVNFGSVVIDSNGKVVVAGRFLFPILEASSIIKPLYNC